MTIVQIRNLLLWFLIKHWRNRLCWNSQSCLHGKRGGAWQNGCTEAYNYSLNFTNECAWLWFIVLPFIVRAQSSLYYWGLAQVLVTQLIFHKCVVNKNIQHPQTSIYFSQNRDDKFLTKCLAEFVVNKYQLLSSFPFPDSGSYVLSK